MNKIIYATIGASGSGKSTWARKFAKDYGIPIVCPDSIREELTGNEGSQERNAEVFRIVPNRLRDALNSSGAVVYDATCYNNSNRKIVEKIAEETGADIEWHVFKVPFATLLHRQTLRDRQVPTDIINRQVDGMTMPSTGKIIHH